MPCSEMNQSSYTKINNPLASQRLHSPKQKLRHVHLPQSSQAVHTRLLSWTVDALRQGLMRHFPASVSSFLLNSRVNRNMLLCRSLHQAIPNWLSVAFSVRVGIIYIYLWKSVSLEVCFREQSVIWHRHPDSHISKWVLFWGCSELENPVY